MAQIPALTIYQPWATLIAEGAKPLEFRSRPAPRSHWGKRLAIHASARPFDIHEVTGLLVRLHSANWRHTGLLRDEAIRVLEATIRAPHEMLRGCILCTALLGTPIRNGDVERALGIPVTNDSDRTEHSNWGLPLTEVRLARPPIMQRGAQGYFYVNVPDELA